MGAAGLAAMAVLALTNPHSGILAERRSVAETRVETTVSAIKAGLSDLGDHDTPVVRKEVAKLIAALRYDENDYFRVNDTSGVTVAHPMRPELNGTNVLDSRDANGTRVFAEFNKAARERGSGFVSYR